jgi:hypothetical protein
VLAGAAAYWLAFPWRLPRLLIAAFLTAFVGESLLTWPNYLSYFNLLAGGSHNGYRHLVDSSLDWGQDLPGLERWLREHGIENSVETPVYLSYFGTALPQYYGVRATSLPSFLEFSQRDLGPLRGGIYCISATMLQGIVEGYRCPGSWTEAYEMRYRRAGTALTRVAAAKSDPRTQQELLHSPGFASPSDLIAEFEQLRFARLCAFLRNREPDDEVGYSILIYRLTDREIAKALDPATSVVDRGR